MFVGMELHDNYLQIAVVNEKGKVLENSRIKNDLKQVGRLVLVLLAVVLAAVSLDSCSFTGDHI